METQTHLVAWDCLPQHRISRVWQCLNLALGSEAMPDEALGIFNSLLKELGIQDLG